MKDWVSILTVYLQKKNADSVDLAKVTTQTEVIEKFWLKLVKKSGICKAVSSIAIKQIVQLLYKAI